MNKCISLMACSFILFSAPAALTSLPLPYYEVTTEAGEGHSSKGRSFYTGAVAHKILAGDKPRSLQRITEETHFVHEKLLSSQLLSPVGQRALLRYLSQGPLQEDPNEVIPDQGSIQIEGRIDVDGAAVSEEACTTQETSDPVVMNLLQPVRLEPEVAIIEAVSCPEVSKSELLLQDPLEQGWHVVPDDVEPEREDKGRVDKLMQDLAIAAGSETQGVTSADQD
jgi:hypothetical protein